MLKIWVQVSIKMFSVFMKQIMVEQLPQDEYCFTAVTTKTGVLTPPPPPKREGSISREAGFSAHFETNCSRCFFKKMN
jgi:hypothetical protein